MEKKHIIIIYAMLAIIIVMQFNLLAKVDHLETDSVISFNHMSQKVDRITSLIFDLQKTVEGE